MIDPVVHISRSTHEAFRTACGAKGVRMRDVADRLISDWVAKAVGKKPQTKPPPKTNTVDPYTAPPFWTGRNGEIP